MAQDGSITLTAEQAEDAAWSLERVIEIVNNQPCMLSEYLTRDELRKVYKTQCLLDGEEYHEGDYFDDEEDDEDEEE